MIKDVRISFDKLITMLPKSYLIRIGNQEYWLPRRMVKQLRTKNNLSGSCTIPTWLYVEKFGQQPPEDIAETIVEKHVPQPIKPIQTEADDTLIR